MDESLRKHLDSLTPERIDLLHDTRPFRALFYGDTDMGKTTLAGQVAKVLGKPTALFATDSNWVVLLNDPEVASLVQKYDFDGFSQIRAFAQAHKEGLESACQFGTLIWDTVSTACLNVRNHMVKVKKFKDQRDPDVASWTHFNLLSMKFEEVIADLRKTDLNIIYTTHLRTPTDKDREEKKFNIRSNMPEASFNLLMQEVPLIGWVHKTSQGTRRIIQFEGTDTETAKSQIVGIEGRTYDVEEVPELVRKWVNR